MLREGWRSKPNAKKESLREKKTILIYIESGERETGVSLTIQQKPLHTEMPWWT